MKWQAFIFDLGYFDFGKLKVNKKDISKLEKQEINLYKCSFIKAISYLMGDIDEYNFKIEEKIFSGSIAEALKKYNIEYEVVDTTSMERERKIIQHRFGLENTKPKTLEELGKILVAGPRCFGKILLQVLDCLLH